MNNKKTANADETKYISPKKPIAKKKAYYDENFAFKKEEKMF